MTLFSNRVGLVGRILAGSLAGLAVACSAGGERPTVVTRIATEAAETPSASARALPTATTRLPASDALRTAQEMLRDGRYDVAAVSFAAIADATGGAARAEAGIGLSLARFQAGDSPGAITALRDAVAAVPAGSTEGVRARYLLGVRLNEGGRFKEAVVPLREVMSTTSGIPLEPYVAAELARAFAGSGDGMSAGKTWDALLANGALSTALRARVLRERSEAARQAGDLADLGRWLDERISTGVDTAAMYERAQLALASGDGERSISLLRSIISGHSGSREAVLSVGELQARGVAVDSGQEGLVYYRRGAYAEAQRALLRAVDEPGLSREAMTFRQYYLAASYEDGGLPAEAVRYYDLAGEGPSAYQHRARYWAARVTESMGRTAEAAERYAILVKDGPPGEFSAEAAFRSGYALYAANHLVGAIAAWTGGPGPRDARTAYWTARALAKLGRFEESAAQYRSAVELGPLDFHGLESARELGLSGEVSVEYRKRDCRRAVDWSVIQRWLETRLPGERSQRGATSAADLVSVGLRSEAAALLFEAARGADAWRLLELAEEAYRAGLVNVSAQLAVRIRLAAGVASHAAPADLLRVAYPVGYVTQVDEQSRIHGLDPLFLAAVVRQESFWDVSAGSPVGALGLTQVMPATGEGIARALEVVGFRKEDLLRPAVSLRFGAYYLAGQLTRLGRPYYALAAYNAGPANAARWIQANSTRNVADFVETIDYTETQHYVAVIMEHYAHYLRAYDE